VTLGLQSPEEVAREHAGAHPGYTLVSYGEVGIPFFELKLQAQVLEHKQIDPFSEFVLRSVSSGVTQMDEMGRLLGLEARVLETTLVTLITKNLLQGAENLEDVQMTEMGEETLAELVEIVPESAQLRVVFDPVLRNVIEPYGDFLQPRELRDKGIKEIGIPARLMPELHHLDVREVERVIRDMGGGREQTRNVLALRSRRRFRVFRTAIALLFRAEGTSDVLIDVAFDGRVSERHTLQLAELGLREKLGADRVGADRFVERRARLQRETEAAADGLKAVECYEHPRYLDEALRDARERLIVTSPGLRSAVLDEEFVEKLDDCLVRGVSVQIGWTDRPNDRPGPNADNSAVQALDRLSRSHPNLDVRRIEAGADDNILICDQRYLIYSDFNWLSFRGDPYRVFGDERGVVATHSAYVAAEAERWADILQK
jgi:hypothetical protein